METGRVENRSDYVSLGMASSGLAVRWLSRANANDFKSRSGEQVDTSN